MPGEHDLAETPVEVSIPAPVPVPAPRGANAAFAAGMGNAAFAAYAQRLAPPRRGGGTTLGRRSIARREATPTGELRDAADRAEKADEISKQAGGVTNIADINAAKAAIRKVDDASGSLELVKSENETNLIGGGDLPTIKAENAATRQQLDFYLGFLGEETRTGVDFTDRYKKAHAQFARLDAMAKQYEATYGVSATTSKGILESEAGAQSAQEAADKFEGDRRKLNAQQSADLTAALGNLTATEGEMSTVKGEVAKASEDARIGFRDCATATARVKKAAEDEKAEEKKKEVDAVKAKISELATIIATPLQIAADVGIAAATGPAAGASPGMAVVPGGSVGAATPYGVKSMPGAPKSASDRLQDAAKDKGISSVKDLAGKLAQGVGQVAAENYYELELQRAQSAQKIASTLSAGYAAEIGGNEVRNTADKWAQQMRILREKSKRFDELQTQLRKQIADIGRAAEAAGLGKDVGARYQVIAEFRAEATLFVNEADMAIQLGKQNVAAMEEGNLKRGAAAYQEGKDAARRYWRASRTPGLSTWMLTVESLNLAIKSTQGEKGGKEVVETLVKELQAYRDSAETYRKNLAATMGGG